MNRYNSPVIKYAQQNNEKMQSEDIQPIKKIDSVIKRSQINYSYEQKYQLGILTEVEYFQWQMELQQKAEEEKRNQDGAVSNEELAALNDILNGDVDMTKHTFWEGEDGDRENISNDAYEEFLKANAIDVSNKTSSSFEELQKQAMTEQDKALEDEVARIQAKFMPTQGNIDELFSMNMAEENISEEEN